MERVSFDSVLKAHAIVAACVGCALLLSPHRLYTSVSLMLGVYSHSVHELARCYGALTLAQAWFAWRTRSIADGRVRRMLAESYALCYGLTAAALLRAFLAAPNQHGAFALLAAVTSGMLSFVYAYFRLASRLKTFQLPGAGDDR